MKFEQFLPGISIDCVIFGFHNNELKVLLLRFKETEKWSLPGGFIGKDESMDVAAQRVLKERTSLTKIFLQQFYTFGEVARTNEEIVNNLIKKGLMDNESADWLLSRFLTVGYYALVDYSLARPEIDEWSEKCEWVSIGQMPDLMYDHRSIIDKALITLRKQLNYYPIGKSLLPEKFTMPELQALYETLLDTSLDRRNFQRKMLGYGILKRLNERRKGGAHKAPFLYRFEDDKYELALENGLNTGW